MKAQSENRRVRISKRLMKDALLNLLERTELSRIYVTAVYEEADVNRSSFWRFPESKADHRLLFESCGHFLAFSVVSVPDGIAENEAPLLRNIRQY